MKPSENLHDDPVLRAVGEHIARTERHIDPGPLSGRILANSKATHRSDWFLNPGGTMARWGLGLGMAGIAATILLAFLLVPSAEARSESAIREAAEHLRLPLERCYLAEVRPEGEAPADDTLPTRSMKVVAADNQFRVEVTRGIIRWSWGRESDGTVWITSGPHRGLRIGTDEQGPGLSWVAELYSLRPETLLTQMLGNCRLREDPRQAANHPRVIHAEPRLMARHAWLRSADVELDAETKAVRKLTLRRTGRRGDGIVVVSFTLIESRPVEHAKFRLEGNLSEPFQIFDKDHHPDRRREILTRWLGPQAEHWLKSSPAKHSRGD
jgi:hypothetical protein